MHINRYKRLSLVTFCCAMLFSNMMVSQSCDSIISLYDLEIKSEDSCGESLFLIGQKLSTSYVDSNIRKGVAVYQICDSLTGDLCCKFGLFKAYQSGEGVKDIDLCKAFNYLRQIANANNLNSIRDSGIVAFGRYFYSNMFRYGFCVERDIFQSYVWLILSNELLDYLEKSVKESLKFDFQILEDVLREEEVENAIRLASYIHEGPLRKYRNRLN